MKEFLIDVERKIEYFEVRTIRVRNAIDAEEAKQMAKEKAGKEEWPDHSEQYTISDEPTEVFQPGEVLWYADGIDQAELVTVNKALLKPGKAIFQYEVVLSDELIVKVPNHHLARRSWGVIGTSLCGEHIADCEMDFSTWQGARTFLLEYLKNNCDVSGMSSPAKVALKGLEEEEYPNQDLSVMIGANIYCISQTA